MPAAGRPPGNEPIDGAAQKAGRQRNGAARSEVPAACSRGFRPAERPQQKGNRPGSGDMKNEPAQARGFGKRNQKACRKERGRADHACADKAGPYHCSKGNRILARMTGAKEAPGKKKAACQNGEDESETDFQELRQEFSAVQSTISLIRLVCPLTCALPRRIASRHDQGLEPGLVPVTLLQGARCGALVPVFCFGKPKNTVFG